MEQKYILTEETKLVNGHTLHRIKAVRNFNDVKSGDLGGFVETEHNLSHEDNAWVYDNAKVYENAVVYGNACVYRNAMVYDNARVFGDAMVCDNARVFGDAMVSGNAKVCADAEVSSIADYIVFKNWWSSGRYFTWTRSNDKWSVGCFYGSGEELIAKAYKDSETSGREYQRIVEYVETIKNL